MYPAWAIGVVTVLCIFALGAILLVIFARSQKGAAIGGLCVLALCLLGIGLSVGLSRSTSSSSPVVPFSSARVRYVNETMYLTTLDNAGIDVDTFLLDSASASRVKPGWRIAGSLQVQFPSGLASLTGDVTILSEQRSATVATGKGLTMVVYRVVIATATNCGGKPCEPACSLDQLRKTLDTNEDSVRNFYLTASLGKFNVANIIIEDAVLPGPVNYVSILGAINRMRPVPQANFYLFVLPGYFPTNGMPPGAGLGDMPGSSSWYFDCNPRVLVHEVLHNLNLGHSGAVLERNGQFDEYADESSVMSRGSLYIVQAPGSRRPIGWLGLAAPQLFWLGWLASDDILRINRNGDYTINSLSSNTGIRAALINGTYWVEWREAKNQDIDLPYAQHYFGSLRNRGSVLNSLLIKNTMGDRRTFLQAMVDRGKKITIAGFTIEHFPFAGTFRVSGFPVQVGETSPPSIPPMPSTESTTTTTRSTTEDPSLTDPPSISIPTGASCVARDSSTGKGVCTTKSKCPASYKLAGCKKGFVCCYGFEDW